MLTGTYARTLDAKHRLVLPPSLRRVLPVELYCLRAPDNRLVLTADFALYPVPPPHVYRIWLMDDRGSRRANVTRWTVPAALREWLGARPGSEVLIAGDGERVVCAVSEAQLSLPFPEGW